MDAHYGKVGAVDCAAHVDAAGKGYPQVVGELHLGEVVVESVHDRLHYA